MYVLLPAASAFTTTAELFRPWNALRAAVGEPPAARLFEAKTRLFGAKEPDVIFWRDSAGWCPFCEMTWLLLEEMRVPYCVRTVPLRRYMLEGEQKDPEYIFLVGPEGVVPSLQFCADAVMDGSPAGGPPVQSVESIFGELERRYPDRFPGGAPGTRARACEGEGSIFGLLRVARRSYEACAGAASSDPIALGALAGALEELNQMIAEADEQRGGGAMGGADVGGPFLEGGATPTVADLMLLPFLERTEAVVPYFFGRDALVTSRVPFGRIARYLSEARREHAAFAALSSDATTLARTNLRYALAGQAPRYSVPSMDVDEEAAAAIDGTSPKVRDAWAAAASATDRHEAAARLASAAERVSAFARRCAELPPAAPSGAARADASEGDAVDAALRALASLLLDGGNADAQRDSEIAAAALQSRYGAGGAAEAAAALEALSLNVGVPRDMSVEPARALRAYARILAAALARTT